MELINIKSKDIDEISNYLLPKKYQVVVYKVYTTEVFWTDEDFTNCDKEISRTCLAEFDNLEDAEQYKLQVEQKYSRLYKNNDLYRIYIFQLI